MISFFDFIEVLVATTPHSYQHDRVRRRAGQARGRETGGTPGESDSAECVLSNRGGINGGSGHVPDL